ncbi:MAG: LacI family DNA-binding transcriptional regulator, partial [Oscillospiraceae bacterium]
QEKRAEMDIKDIARLSSTSVATVSRVLNNDTKVSERTKLKVQAVIDQTGYKPNCVGRSLRRKRSKQLLIMLPTINNPFYSEIVVGFEQEARANGYGVLVAVTHRNKDIEQQYFELLFTRQVDGVASFIPTISHSKINEIAKQYPFVACCWRGGADIDASYVCIDNEKAAYDTVKFLIDVGHTKIAAMNGNYKERIYEQERERGFYRALADADITIPKEYYIHCEYDFRAAYQATEKLMALPSPPTAIFAMADERAAGVIKFLNEHNYSVAVDVDVVGFDDTVISEITIPEITTVAQPRLEIGREAVGLLISQINNGNLPNKGIIMAHKLIERGSTRKVDKQIKT